MPSPLNSHNNKLSLVTSSLEPITGNSLGAPIHALDISGNQQPLAGYLVYNAYMETIVACFVFVTSQKPQWKGNLKASDMEGIWKEHKITSTYLIPLWKVLPHPPGIPEIGEFFWRWGGGMGVIKLKKSTRHELECKAIRAMEMGPFLLWMWEYH
jgi:hypothetical protein